MRFLCGALTTAIILAASSQVGAAEQLKVSRIQGIGPVSPYAGTFVRTGGLVTLVAGNNFYIQGESDGDVMTMDGVLVRATHSLGVKPEASSLSKASLTRAAVDTLPVDHCHLRYGIAHEAPRN